MSPSRKSEAVGKSKAVEQVDGKAGSRARPYASGKTRRQVRADVRRRYERYMRRLLEHENLLASPTDDNPYGGLSGPNWRSASRARGCILCCSRLSTS